MCTYPSSTINFGEPTHSVDDDFSGTGETFSNMIGDPPMSEVAISPQNRELMILVSSRSHLDSGVHILVTSFTFAALLFALPREYKEDERGGGANSPVPTVIFDTLPPSTFHVFVLPLILAFSFSLSALLIHDSPDHNSTTANKTSGNSQQHLVVNLFGCSSLASIATALAILFRALLLIATEAYYSSSAPTTGLRRSCSNAGAVFIA